MKAIVPFMIALWLVTTSAYSQSNSVFEIIPENPGKPLTVESSNLYTSVVVTGYEGTSVLVELYKSNGRTRMNNPPIQYTEDEGRIVLSHNLITTKNLQFKIKVPRNTKLKLKGSLASLFEVHDINADVEINSVEADIKVVNLEGNLDAKTFNGDILVNNLTGSPLLSTNDGDVELVFNKLPESYPNIIICNYGNLKLYLAPDDKVSIRFKMNFNFEKIKSDFRLQGMNPKSFPMAVNSSSNFYRSINGGGTPIYIRQFKGSVQIISRTR